MNPPGAVLNEQEIMMRLIKGDLVISPLLDPNRQIGPTSVDIRLGFEFEVFNINKHTHLDPTLTEAEILALLEDYTAKVHVEPMSSFILHPGEFVLAATLEYFIIPKDLAGRLEGRSSWGRLGLQVHSTAGFVDPGFEGILTFELQNMGKEPLCLFPGVRIAQICLFNTNKTAIPYTKKQGAKYFRNLGTAGSLFYEDPEFKAIREFHENQRESRNPLSFSASDFIDVSALVTKLSVKVGPSEYLWSRLSAAEEKILLGDNSVNQKRIVLATLFNRLLFGESFYEDKSFKTVVFSDKTKSLLSQNKKGLETIRLKRLVLEEAYVSEIARHNIQP
jgi:dCTP deaminase